MASASFARLRRHREAAFADEAIQLFFGTGLLRRSLSSGRAFARTRWLAYVPAIHVFDAARL